MDEQGYIALYRKMMNWDWYQDSNTKSLFIHLLLKANFKDNNFQGELIKRGQHKTGLYKLVAETGLSIQQIRTSLKKLEKTNDITSISTNKYRIITVTKYDEYQSTNKQDNNQVTNKQQTNNKQITTNNKDNKEYKEKNVIKESLTDFEIAINDFKEFRKKLKKPMTDRAIELLKNNLDKLATKETDKIQILEQSIMNGWTSVYALNENQKNTKTTKTPLSAYE